MPILNKLAEIRANTPPIEKKGKMTLGGTKVEFMKIEDIDAALKPLFNERKIIVRPRAMPEHTTHEFHHGTDVYTLDGKPTGDGRVRSVRATVHLWVEYTFIDTEDGSEFTVVVPAEAFDSQDKATRKAMTAAWKTCLLQTFGLSENGDDQDGDDVESRTQAPAAAPKQDRSGQKRTQARGTSTARTPVAEEAASETAPDITADQQKMLDAVQSSIDTSPKPPTESPWTPDPADVATAQEVTAAAAEAEVGDTVVVAGIPFTKIAEPDAAPQTETESAGPVEDTPDALAKAKNRLRAAVSEAGGLTKEAVDAVAEHHGLGARTKWILSSRAIGQLAAAIEKGEVG